MPDPSSLEAAQALLGTLTAGRAALLQLAAAHLPFDRVLALHRAAAADSDALATTAGLVDRRLDLHFRSLRGHDGRVPFAGPGLPSADAAAPTETAHEPVAEPRKPTPSRPATRPPAPAPGTLVATVPAVAAPPGTPVAAPPGTPVAMAPAPKPAPPAKPTPAAAPKPTPAVAAPAAASRPVAPPAVTPAPAPAAEPVAPPKPAPAKAAPAKAAPAAGPLAAAPLAAPTLAPSLADTLPGAPAGPAVRLDPPALPPVEPAPARPAADRPPLRSAPPAAAPSPAAAAPAASAPLADDLAGWAAQALGSAPAPEPAFVAPPEMVSDGGAPDFGLADLAALPEEALSLLAADPITGEVTLDDASRTAAAAPVATTDAGNAVPTLREPRAGGPPPAMLDVRAARGVSPVGVRAAGEEIEVADSGDSLADDDDAPADATSNAIGMSVTFERSTPARPAPQAPRLTDEDAQDHTQPSAAMVPPAPPPIIVDDKQLQAMLDDAQAYARKGDLQRAIQGWTDALDMRHTLIEAHIGRGRCYLELGDYSSAMSDFARAEDLNPDRPDPHVAMGDLYFARKEYKRAIEFYDQAVEIDGSHAMARCRRGISHYYRKNHRQAFQDLQRALALDPEIPNIRKYVQMAQKKLERGE
jgi:Flp pilus assembly protein TadD